MIQGKAAAKNAAAFPVVGYKTCTKNLANA